MMCRFKNRYLSIFLVFSFLSTFYPAVSGMVSETLVVTEAGKCKTVNLLTSGDRLISYDFFLHETVFPKVKLVNAFHSRSLIEIQTNGGSILVGKNKLIFEAKHLEWKLAKDFIKGDCLLNIHLKSKKVEEVKKIKLEKPITLYEIELKEPNAYFILDSSGEAYLVHNGFFAALVALAAKLFATSGTATAVVGAGGSIVPIILSTGGTATAVVGAGGPIILSTGTITAGSIVSATTFAAVPVVVVGGAAYTGYKVIPYVGRGIKWACSSKYRKRLRNERREREEQARREEALRKAYSELSREIRKEFDVVISPNDILRAVQSAKIKNNASNQTSTATPPPPEDPNKKDDDKKEEHKNNEEHKENKEIDFRDNSIDHIFKPKAGHLHDNPTNRKLLKDIANDPRNLVGHSLKGNNEWYAKILENGKQVYVRVNEGKIVGGGLNDVPRVFDPVEGLCRLPNT